MISSSDEEFRLEQFDCICIPPRTGYSIENLDSSDLTLAWTVSPSYDIQHPVEMLSSKKLRVIRTLKEIDPIRFSAPGMERSIYNIKETESFHFALFIRGARTFSPLHTHLPKDFEESFTVLNGNLFVTGLEGESYQLHKFDTAYVPAYGGNCNENKSDEFVKYLWTGSPPVDVKEIPVQKEFSKYEKDLAVDK
jgi:mannose-6-phosphate isomerase-like protein (cupin superfamily)